MLDDYFVSTQAGPGEFADNDDKQCIVAQPGTAYDKRKKELWLKEGTQHRKIRSKSSMVLPNRSVLTSYLGLR